MPREAKVKYEDIARACVRIIGRGKHPTIDAVYEEVGRISSRSTINRLRNEFLENFQKQGIGMLPASMPEALIPAVEDFWAIALVEAGKSYSEYEQAYEEKLAGLEDQLSEIKETVAVQEKMLEDRQRELRLAYEAKTSMAEELGDVQSKLKGRDAIVDRLRNDKDQLNQKLADERAEADRRYDKAAQDWEAERSTFKETLETLKATSRESEAKQERLTDYWTVQVQDARDQVSDVKERMREEKERFLGDQSLDRARIAQMSKQIDRLTVDLDKTVEALSGAQSEKLTMQSTLEAKDLKVVNLTQKLDEERQKRHREVAVLKQKIQEAKSHKPAT